MKIKIGRDDVENLSFYIEKMIDEWGNDGPLQSTIQSWITDWIKEKVERESDAVKWHFGQFNK